MRVLVVIAKDHYVRNFVTTGALDGLDPAETLYVAAREGVSHESMRALLEAQPGYLGTVQTIRFRAAKPFRVLRWILLAALRNRSRTMRDKFRQWPRSRRIRYALLALPGVRAVAVRTLVAVAGDNPELHRKIETERPDLIVAPSGGYDPMVWDAIRIARRLDIPSLLLIHNWDNLSSKGAFAVKPDWLGVWGEQSVEHAVRIHDFPRERVAKLGAPSLDPYFRHPRGSTESPFGFRYALFAGCYAPFDERSALESLEREIEARGLDLKIVYRPHPHRRPRRVSDLIDENEFSHVVIDPQMCDIYQASKAEYTAGTRRAHPLFPPLDYYPALFEHAEFVICPLSTMIVEAAAFERRVIVVAYDDGIHPNPPSVVVDYDHFEGIDRIDGFRIARTAADLPRMLSELERGEGMPQTPLREQIRWWLHHDERTYAERLRELCEEVAGEPATSKGRERAALARSTAVARR